MDLIVTQNVCEFKVCNTNLYNQPYEFILKNASSPTATNDSKSKAKESTKTDLTNDYEKMLYFVCNLCPYLCIKDTKITEHLENVHKDNKTSSNPLQLKCPACPNIFYRNMSLKSHLVHDHKVASSDLHQIVQAVIYYAKKSCNSVVKTNDNKNGVPPMQNASCKSEIDMNLIEKLMNSDKLVNNEPSKELNIDNTGVIENTSNVRVVKDVQQEDVETLQRIDVINHRTTTSPILNTAHNTKDTLSAPIATKKTDTFSKFLDQKMMHKCTVSSCKVCMNDLNKLDYHLKCHVESTFKCFECNELFAFWKPLTVHLWRMHKIDMELYTCDKCDYKSPSLWKLNNSHRLIHSDVRAYECDICNKKFKNTNQLRNHKSIHSNKLKNYIHTCETCVKAFSDKRQLTVHMDVVHKKIKPFLCSYCGYKGASKSTLKMHIRQHTGEKPFSCDLCEYSTADHNSLRRHKLRHTGHKPYKCSHCNYACIQTSTYKEHIRTKHPGVEKDFVFTCKECQFRSVNQDMFLSHQFLVHRQKT